MSERRLTPRMRLHGRTGLLVAASVAGVLSYFLIASMRNETAAKVSDSGGASGEVPGVANPSGSETGRTGSGRTSATHPNSLAPAGESRPVTDPKLPGYNAFALHKLGGRNPEEIYAEEPRREPWATEREKAIDDFIRADILAHDPKAILEIDCRTSSCRTRIYSESPFLTSEFGGFPFGCWAKLMTGDLEQRDRQGRMFANLYSLFGADNLEAQGFETARDQWCLDEQRKFREAIKQPYRR